jgi:protein-disulfide isomerase
MEPNYSTTSWTLPVAVVVGFALIALAIFFTRDTNNPQSAATSTVPEVVTIPSVIKPVDDSDYIKGNPNAPILIVEYSDYDCPFCKSFHSTMNQIMDEYAVTGKVAWVYRQLPIVDLHPMSERISLNALCVGEKGGNDAFWEFSNLIFDQRELNEPTNITRLPEYAESAGVKRADLIACLDSRSQEAVLEASLADAKNAGIEGTPYSYVIVGNQIEPITGAQPYVVMKSVIDNLLNQLEGTTPLN